MKLRLLLICDLDDWILGTIANHLTMLLSSRFQVTMLASHAPKFRQDFYRNLGKCDLIHFLSPWDFFTWGALTSKPCAVTLWHMVDWKPFDDHVWRMDGVWIPTKQWTELAKPHLPDGVPICKMRYGIDAKKFKRDESARARYLRDADLPIGTYVIGFAGSAWSNEGGRKGVDRLWECLRLLKKSTSIPFVLRIIGRAWPRDMVPEDLRSEVHFGQFLDSDGLVDFYSSLDYYFCPSRVEGYVYPALEAMSTKCVVLATPVGILPEIIHSGVNGFLLNDGCLASNFVQAIERTAVDSLLRNFCGAKAREDVLRHLSWDKVIDQAVCEAFYYSTIKHFRKRPLLNRFRIVAKYSRWRLSNEVRELRVKLNLRIRLRSLTSIRPH